jgi:Flp pilus assembly protein TadG
MTKLSIAVQRLFGQSSQAGQGIVEFVVILPMVLLILLGITDLGRAVFYLNTMGHASREGARSAIVLQTTDKWAIDGNQPKVYSSAQPYVGTDTVVGRVTNFLEGMALDQTKITLEAPQGTQRYMSLPMTVRVEYTYQPVTNFLGVPSIPLKAESTMQIE